MVKMKFKYISILFIVLSVACTNQSSQSSLEEALSYAGENRLELEKVLNHYTTDPKDSLKYRAAVFLIENMPMHYSYTAPDLFTEFLAELDSLALRSKDYSLEQRDRLWTEVYQKYDVDGLPVVSDAEIVTADYLIENIEQSFEVWHDAEWARHLSFEDFCEYILPYKVMEGQELDNWREYCRASFNRTLDISKHSSLTIRSASSVCNIVTENMRQKIFPRTTTEAHLPINRIKTLLEIPSGTCNEYTIMALAVLRAKGIPVAIDFTPQWAFRSLGHDWNVLLENTGKMGVFEGANTPVGTPHKKDHIMAKVYRRTYAFNKEIGRIYQVQKEVPEFLEEPFIKDVTNEYMHTKDVTLSLKNKPDYQYAYLAVFNNANWFPVSWGKVSRNKAIFENMGKDVAYLPVKYTNRKGVEAIDDPFILTIKGDVRKLIPDMLNREVLKLYRKYPLMPYAYDENQRLIGAKIQAANRADFKDSVTIHYFTDLDKEILIEEQGSKYRYWRFLSAPTGYSNIAELRFFERNSLQSTSGAIIGTDGSYRTGMQFAKEAAFDGDLLTFFDAPTQSGAWVGMDFGKPVDISRITCVMRSDGNDIEVGHEYELLFWQSGKWQSLGKKTATDIYLTYEDCPTNSLFLLRNHTKGKEERIFTYENGKQVWW